MNLSTTKNLPLCMKKPRYTVDLSPIMPRIDVSNKNVHALMD